MDIKEETHLKSHEINQRENFRHSKSSFDRLVSSSDSFSSSNEEEGGDYFFDFKKLVLGLRRHLLLIFFFALGGAFCGIYLVHYLTHTYHTSAILFYQEEKPKSINENQPLIFFSLPTLIDLIQLPSHFEVVKSLLGLKLTSSQIAGMVTVPTPKESSNFLSIKVKGDNPALIVDIANTLARVAVRDTQDFYRQQLVAQRTVLLGQRDALQEKLNFEIAEIETFKNKYNYYEMNPEHNSLLTEINDLKSKLLNATLQYNGIVVEYDNLKQQAEHLPESILNEMSSSTTPTPLDMRITAVETSLLEAQAKYAADNPKLKTLEDQLTELKNQVKQSNLEANVYQKSKNILKEKLNVQLLEMEGKVLAAKRAQEDLQKEIADKEKMLEGLPKRQMVFSELLSKKLISQSEISNLESSLQLLSLMMKNASGELQLYQLAETSKPLSSFFPLAPLLPELLTIAGLLFGAGIGLAVALLIEMRDSKIRTARQIHHYYKLPCIISIPEFSFLSKRNGEQKTLYYVRNLVDHLQHISHNLSFSSLALVSALDGEGKSLLSYYLALYYQRLGKKVLILDFDYAPNPFVENEESPPARVESFLRSEKTLEEIIAKTHPDRIKMEEKETGMKELIKSEKMQQLLQLLKSSYEMLIIDTPGIIKNDYALNLATVADQVLYVVGSSTVEKKFVDASMQELQAYGIKPCGIALNCINSAYIDDVRITSEKRRNFKYFFAKTLRGNYSKT